MTHSSIILPVDKLHILREWVSQMFGPPLDDVTMCVACTNVLDMTPDPMSTHFKSLDLMSLVLTFGAGWLLRLLISLGGGRLSARRRVQRFLASHLPHQCLEVIP